MFFPIKLRLLAFNFEDRPRERKQILKNFKKNNRFITMRRLNRD